MSLHLPQPIELFMSAWRRETEARHHHTVRPVAIAKRAGKTVVTTGMAGNCAGSPCHG